ncbi:hypothetical protein NE857_09180 [Nocardiopsis exhalans]|uniref:Head-to-tail adaptor n=1 Tax=Nocardiopsis exhalans TaxID=163604 RepID=A0ABY5DE46_9ACTN|nr:hypothetical protein [Nocardiopsis exhalans]USY21753.1 hypothetical protein NE857_09180 [Nocardiopsis exhalans]
MWATAEEYARRTGVGLTVENRDQITALLEDAQAFIGALLPAGCVPDAAVARAVLIKVARRAHTNPGGLTSRRVGDVQESYDDRGGLFVSEHELAALTARCPTRGAYTVQVSDPGLRRVGGAH